MKIAKELQYINYRKIACYALLGCLTFFAGLIYNSIPDDDIIYGWGYYLIKSLANNWQVMLFSMFCSVFFYIIFFQIRQNINKLHSILKICRESTNINKIDLDLLLSLNNNAFNSCHLYIYQF